MKLSEISQPKLRTDNPGGRWLQGKIDAAKEYGPNEYGRPHLGTVTGSFKDPVRLPVSLLKDMPGSSGEQQNVRHDDLKWLVDHMKTTGKLPLMDNGEVYAPFVVVAYDGSPWVQEGNHRIMAAAALGWKTLPVELRYFNGSENVDGPLHPDKL